MRRIASRIAVLLIVTLLAQSSPLFAQRVPPSRTASSFHDSSRGSTYQRVDVMTPSQFVEPPAFTRHTWKHIVIGGGIAAGVMAILGAILYHALD